MAGLCFNNEHLAWQQRLANEKHATNNFHHAVNEIMENRSPDKKLYTIKPHKQAMGSKQTQGRGVPNQKTTPNFFMIDSSYVNAANPNTMRNLGHNALFDPNRIQIESDQSENDQLEERMDEVRELDEDYVDNEDDDNKSVRSVTTTISEQSNISNRSKVSERHKQIQKQIRKDIEKNKEKEKLPPVNNNIQKDDDCISVVSSVSKRSSKSKTIKGMQEKIAVSHNEVKNTLKNNPLLKKIDDDTMSKYSYKSGMSKSKSLKSMTTIASNTSLHSYVRSLQQELEHERRARKKAEEILQKVKSDKNLIDKYQDNKN